MRINASKNAADVSGLTAPMTEADIPHVLSIERGSFPVPWRRRSFLEELNNKHSLNIVIKIQGLLENDVIRAYSCNQIVGDELTVLRMAVAPECRRNGLAGQLLDTVLKLSKRKGAITAYLEVRPSNAPGRSLYQKKGFQIIGTRPGYYNETGEDALVMMKRLKEIS